MASQQRYSTPGVHQGIWHAATAHIEAHLSGPLTLDDVAHAAFTSRRQLQRVFATAGGTTVRTYIVAERMRRACELLIASDRPLSGIAADVGYGHAASFVKAFRVHHGVTPTEMRRRHRRQLM